MAAVFGVCARGCAGLCRGCASCARSSCKLCTRCCRSSSKAIKKAGKKSRRGSKRGRSSKRSNSEGGDTIIIEASDSSDDNEGGWFGESPEWELPPLMLKMERDAVVDQSTCLECGDKIKREEG